MSDEADRDDEVEDEAEERAGATGEAREEPRAKDELFEAIDHFKSAASILFDRARNDPSLRAGMSEAERLAKKLGDAAEPLARQLTGELERMTKDVRSTVEGATRKKKSSPPPADSEPASSDEESDEEE